MNVRTQKTVDIAYRSFEEILVDLKATGLSGYANAEANVVSQPTLWIKLAAISGCHACSSSSSALASLRSSVSKPSVNQP
jgi:hypothetical protein